MAYENAAVSIDEAIYEQPNLNEEIKMSDIHPKLKTSKNSSNNSNNSSGVHVHRLLKKAMVLFVVIQIVTIVLIIGGITVVGVSFGTQLREGEQKSDLSQDVKEIKDTLKENEATLKENKANIKTLLSTQQRQEEFVNCLNVNKTGVYFDKRHFGKWVLCQIENTGIIGGGWTIIMRRQDGSVNFTRSWEEYGNGFGNLFGEFWLGNEYVHKLTDERRYQLRIDAWDKDNKYMYAVLNDVKIGSQYDKYKITYNGFAGNMTNLAAIQAYLNGQRFSTFDKDNDNLINKNCVNDYKGGWWFKECYLLCLTCTYHNNLFNYYAATLLRKAVMMIR